MSVQNYVFGITASALVLLYIIFLLRRERLKERHAIWWLILAALALVFSIAPELLTTISSFTGFGIPANMVFFVSIAVLFLVSIQTSTEITTLEEQNRTLAEKVAVLELQLRELQRDVPKVRKRR